MSFDDIKNAIPNTDKVSIPFEQGDVFRQKIVSKLNELGVVSIPFEQGDVFRQK